MEEIGATIPKYQSLRDLWRPLCDYTRRTILSRPIRPFTRQLVPSDCLKNQYPEVDRHPSSHSSDTAL